ncbi:Lrp/AsnC family transcriptional regulator [Nocardia panacis]|uniref:Lrp/AsnC family transcriptional regulator n=1 Tax=Nocardia panacis TaxID=2340916 RepID=A0A3A4K8C6_9NOCA|nr:Lrp/AsnC family transcriptional regulator [Nocardia panacis]RJO73822.1 Lrp/AsnC family transcriptional regulator [Nocardia panacis]
MAPGTPPLTHELDDIDRRLIRELVANGRISMRALAESAHISRAHAYVRVERLQEAGIIDGYTTRISHERAGLGASAFIALSIKQDSWRGLAKQLRTLPFVEHFALVGGDFDVLVLVRAPDNHTLRNIVLDQLNSLEGVRATRTWLIFDEANGPGAWLGLR